MPLRFGSFGSGRLRVFICGRAYARRVVRAVQFEIRRVHVRMPREVRVIPALGERLCQHALPQHASASVDASGVHSLPRFRLQGLRWRRNEVVHSTTGFHDSHPGAEGLKLRGIMVDVDCRGLELVTAASRIPDSFGRILPKESSHEQASRAGPDQRDPCARLAQVTLYTTGSLSNFLPSTFSAGVPSQPSSTAE